MFNANFSKLSLFAVFLSMTLASCSTPEKSEISHLDSTPTGKTIQTYLGSEAGFLVTSNLIKGQHEAILVDAQFTRSDATKVVAMIQQSGLKLKTVFVTHGHPDHYFGIETLRKAFPNAKYVASRDTVSDIKATGLGKLSYWKTIYGAELPDAVPVVEEVSGEDLVLEGEALQSIRLGAGESEHAEVIVVPSMKAALVGDMAYDEVHLWLAEAEKSTSSWKANLDMIQKSASIEKIYVGHQKAIRVNSKDLLTVNSQYIDNALKIFSASSNSVDASKALQAKYPTYSLPIIADLAAKAFVK